MRNSLKILAGVAAVVALFASSHGAATAAPFPSGLAGESDTRLPITNADYYGRRGGWSYGFSYGGPRAYGYGYAPGPRYGYRGYVAPRYGYGYRGYPRYRRYYGPGYYYGYRPYRRYRNHDYPYGYGDS